MKMPYIYVLIIILVPFTGNSYAAEFSKSEIGVGISINGAITEGDYDKFIKAIYDYSIESKWPGKMIYPTSFMISSPGGNLNEALKMAELIEKLKLSVFMSGECNSACVFLLIAAPERIFCCRIGLHRPAYATEYFSGLKIEEAESIYNDLLNSSNEWLEKRHVSSEIIQGLISTPSYEASFIDYNEAEKLIGERSPAYDEWLSAKCGFMTDDEKMDLRTVFVKEMFIDKGESIYQTDNLELNEYLRSQLMKANNMSLGYLDYLRKKNKEISSCIGTELFELRNTILN